MKKKSLTIVIITTAVLVIATSTVSGIYFGYVKPKRDNEVRIRKLFEEYYNAKVAQFEEENKTLSDVDVCCLGDSLTDGYDFKQYYPQFNMVNRGIGGDTTFGLQKRLKVSAYDTNPKVVTMLIGANNFKTMLNNYEQIVVDLRENLPNSQLVLLSLTSMCKEWGKNNEIAQKNNIEIKKYAEKYNCTYVDLYNPLLDPDTNQLREEWTTDGGHFTPSGYQVVTDIITPVLTELLN